jgi:hypothetical protein
MNNFMAYTGGGDGSKAFGRHITGSGGVLKSHNSLAKVNRDDNGPSGPPNVSLNHHKI